MPRMERRFEVDKSAGDSISPTLYDSEVDIIKKIVWGQVIDAMIETHALADMSKSSGRRCEECGTDISERAACTQYCYQCAEDKQTKCKKDRLKKIREMNE